MGLSKQRKAAKLHRAPANLAKRLHYFFYVYGHTNYNRQHLPRITLFQPHLLYLSGKHSHIMNLFIKLVASTFAANFGIAHQNTTLYKAYIQKVNTKQEGCPDLSLMQIIMVRREITFLT